MYSSDVIKQYNYCVKQARSHVRKYAWVIWLGFITCIHMALVNDVNGGIQYFTPSGVVSSGGGSVTIPSLDDIHGVSRSLTTASSISTSQRVCDRYGGNCVQVYNNSYGLQSKGEGSIQIILRDNAVMKVEDNDNAGIIRFQESDRSVQLPAQTASRCARFDATSRLVAASGDCSAGDTSGIVYIQMHWACGDHATDTSTFMSTDGGCDTSENGFTTTKVPGLSGTLTRIDCRGTDNGPANGDTWTFTARVGLANTDLTCQITTPNGTCSDTGSAAVTPTSQVTIAFDDTETVTALGGASCTLTGPTS